MGIKENPVLKRVMELGEAQIGRLANQLLSNENFVSAIQQMVARTLAAKGTLDKSLRSALAAMNLPSTADVEELRRRLDDLDRLMTDLDAKLTRLEKPAAAKPAAAPKAGARKPPRKAPAKKKTEA